MITSVLSIVIGIFILGILVFVHELGHFLVAKWSGFRVLTFALGFGTPLLSKKIGDTDYRINSIPFGGYVKMAGENPDEEHKGSPDEFQSRPVWQRAFVAIAGPAANFLFAFALLWIMYIYGVQRPLYLERPIIGEVSDSSAALAAGLAAGDSVVSVNGHPISSWEDIEDLLSRQDSRYEIVYVRGSQMSTAVMTPAHSNDAIPKQPTGGLMPPVPAIVGEVVNGSPAQKAGIKAGDTVTIIDGRRVFSWIQMNDMIQHHTASKEPMHFTMLRNNTTVAVQVTPAYDAAAKRKLVGIKAGEGKSRYVKYAPAPAFKKSVDKSWEYTTMIFDVLGKLISRQVSVNQLSGPVGIIPASGFIALQGLSPILNFMALIGINLAVLNLLPLVITDGGLLLFLLIEAVRRKPLSLQTQSAINRVAIFLFLALFVYISINDIKRLPEYFQFFHR